MRYYSNTAVATTLANSGGITPTSTQLILDSTTGYPTQFPFTLRLDPDTQNEELVTVNSGAGTSSSPYVVSRGSDGTTAKSHAQYSPVTHGFSARDLREPQDHMADSWAHTRRPLWTKQSGSPAFVNNGVWTNFTSSTWAALTFTSPPSGIIKVTLGARIVTRAGSFALSLRISGGLTVSPSDHQSILTEGGDTLAAGRVFIFSGITPNVSTTVTPAWWMSASGDTATAEISGGLMLVELQP